MGLGNHSGGNTTYLTIINGQITRKVTEGTPGAVPRTNKQNNVVYELHYDSLSGMIKSIETKDGDFGKQWLVNIVDDLDNFQLQIPYSGKYAYSILRRLPNIDFNIPVMIKTGIYEEKPYLTISQDGEKVEYFFTKDNPNGLPEMENILVKGKPTWDDTKRLIWLENYVFENITPALNAIYGVTDDNTPASTGQAPSQEFTPDPTDDTSDLPF
jgi:hypothetical protein